MLQNLPNESIQYNLHNRDLVPYTYSNSVTSILSRIGSSSERTKGERYIKTKRL